MEIIEHHRAPVSNAAAARPEGWWERQLRRPVTAWLIFGLSLLITGAAWWVSRHYAHDEAHQRFERRTDEIHARLRARMESYGHMLRGGAALFASSDQVSRHDWRRFFDTLQPDQHYLGLQGFGVSRWLRPDELDEHEAEVRAEGFADYQVRPPGAREAYSSIVFLEPFAGRNLRAFGFDMYSEPVRREAMQRARETGQQALSGIVTLVQEDGRNVQKGFLVYQPLYRSGTGKLSGMGAPAALWGWVYAPFRVNDLMDGILGQDLGNIALRIHDGVPVEPADAFYDSERVGASRASTAQFEHQLPLDFAGRRWAVVYRGSDFIAPAAALQSTVVAAGGLTVDLMLFVTIVLLSRRKNQFELQMRARGAEAQARMAWLHGVGELSPDGALVFERGEDGATRLVFTNPAFSRLFGLRPGDLLGLTEPAVDEWLQGLAREGESLAPLGPAEASLRLSGPGARVLRRTMREDQHRRVYYFRDITRENEVERLKNEFLTTAAHELRTPLASVYGFSELMQRADVGAAQRERASTIVYRQAGVLKHLVDELLDLARLDARGVHALTTQRLDLREVASQAAESLLQPEQPTRVTVHLGEAPLWVLGDAGKLRQMVLNLLSNAVKYSPENAAISLVAMRDARAGGVMALLRVADRGIGMTPEQRARAFERFYRADPSGHVPGAGLGLALVQEIVRLHGGEVALDSSPGVGTQVSVWLPLAVDNAADGNAPGDEAALSI